MEKSTGTQRSEENFPIKKTFAGTAIFCGNTTQLRFFAGMLGCVRFFFGEIFTRAIWAKRGDL